MADKRLVSTVRVVCHTEGRMGAATEVSDNHWSIYLVIDQNSSVRLNMRADKGYVTGDLEINTHNYSLTNSSVRHWDFQAPASLAVDDVVQLIYSNRRDLYNMSGGGSGCRYWVWVIISDMAVKGYLRDTQAGQRLWPCLLFRYSRNADPIPLQMVKGEFVDA